MNNFNRLILFVLLTSTVSYVAVAQPSHVVDHIKKLMPNPVPQSPNVAGLGKYGDYQVNHFNGIPEISIPIFEAKSGSLSVPITLSYHASGVKPTDVASWVGMGWSLSAGGQVARNVQGDPDENHYQTNVLKQNVAVCGPPGVGTFYYLKDIAASGNDADTEPDIFSYSYPGAGGKFILPYGSTPILFPYSPIVISTSAGFPKFEITDERGVLHRFGINGSGTLNAYDNTFTTTGMATAWHLMDIVSPNSNDQISFEYQSLGSSNTHDISYAFNVLDQCHLENVGPEGPSCPNLTTLIKSNNDSYISQKDIRTITFETGKVVFELTSRNDVPGLSRLDRIEIFSNGVAAPQKTIKFNYSYFKNAVLGDQALKLDGIQFLDDTNTPVQNYSFDYFTNSFSWTPNDINFLNARDLWGYYNGATGNTDMILPQTIAVNITDGSPTTNISFGGAYDRNVNTSFIKEGVLKRINYPTGGYTEFDFESNKYDKNGVPTNAGGLRVKKITSYDGNAAVPIVKSYKYGNAESGLGLANFLDNEFNYISTQLFYSDCEGIMSRVNYQSRTYFSKSFGGESTIMYPYVTEYIGDPSGITNGKTVYVYDNGSPSNDTPNTIPGSTKIYKNNFAWKRGKLTSKAIYDNANRIISSTSIDRTLFKDASNFVGWSVYQFIAGNFGDICSGSGAACYNEANERIHGQTFMFGSIYQSSGVLLETSVSETTYENGDVNKSITKSSSSQFDPTYLQVTQATQSIGTSENVINKFKYPFNYTYTGTETGSALGAKLLKDKNVLATPIEQYTIKQVGSAYNVIGGQVTTFKTNPGNTNFVSPDVIYLLETASPIQEASYSATSKSSTAIIMDARYKPAVNLFQDLNGNVLQAQQINNVFTAYQWGYNNSLPVAKVQNAQNNTSIGLKEFQYESFEESTGAAIKSGPLKAHTGNNYYEGDYITTFANPNARAYKIEYWYYDTKWNYISKNYTGIMSLSEGIAIDNVRIYPKDAQMMSYTYEPIYGITSSISESGYVKKFEYDSFGRLALVVGEDGSIEAQYLYHYKEN